MDFSPDEGQQAVADVVTSVLERDNSWEALVDGGVTALGVPERLGGDGLGLPEIATALTEIGRHGTVSPALATLGLGCGAARSGLRAQQDRYLAGVAKGSVLTFGAERAGCATARPAGCSLSGVPGGHKLNGTKVACAYAEQADWIVVTTDSGVAVVAADADGVTADQDADVERFRRVRGHRSSTSPLTRR